MEECLVPAHRNQHFQWLGTTTGMPKMRKVKLGVWVGMEPNALDGKDAEFVGTPGSDASGRFLPYWNRASGEVALETLTGYDDTGSDGAYYQTPKRLRKEAIVEPYPYT